MADLGVDLLNHKGCLKLDDSRMIEFLRRLIQTPSLSGKESKLADLVSKEMKALSYSVERDDMGNIIGRRGGGRGKTVLFDGHLDHVGEGSRKNWSRDPYSAEIVDDVLYGRGAVDMKGSLAAMIHGCAAAEIEGEAVLSCVVHEETAEGVATRKIIEDHKLKVDACVLGEPTNLNLSIGQRGRCVIRITTKGITSHASMPELGVNALYKMIPIINRLEEMSHNMRENPFLGASSMAVTNIAAYPGIGPIIPDRCEIILDRRLVPEETLENVLQELTQIAYDSEIEVVEEELECYTGYKTRVKQYFPGWLMNENDKVVKDSLAILEKTVGIKPKIIGWRFSTDGVATAGILGIPTIGFGPGDPALAHQPNERISISDVVKAAEGFRSLSASLSAS
ncbi:MAG: YgeY family selenium metabolism-linked hydrolase [Candidatus Bathyarchaeia archaeon]